MTTRVDVAEIRLPKPSKKGAPPPKKTYARATEGAWAGLDGLDARIAAEGSLVSDTLREMENDAEFQLTAKRLREEGAQRMTLEEKKKRRRALDALGVPNFTEFVATQQAPDAEPVTARRATSVLQLNIGLYCNQACGHCHVESSPRRTESMSDAVADRCVDLVGASPTVSTVDITGGAPELNPAFRRVVERVAALDEPVEVIDRCNLTVLTEPGQEDLADFLAEHRVRVVASLPCYSAKNVNMQRGKGVFDRSIAGLRALNDRGYGVEGSGLALDLVYNPLGAFLPPHQAALEAKYRDELSHHFGVVFTNLFTITNMPIKRFADFLFRRGELEEYMGLLVRNFNLSTVDGVMCKETLSVGWDGQLYDCDFNQQLLMGLDMSSHPQNHKTAAAKTNLSVFDIDKTDDLLHTPITHDNHCFGCTAGMGSS